jgi:hypothetical protein
MTRRRPPRSCRPRWCTTGSAGRSCGETSTPRCRCRR